MNKYLPQLMYALAIVIAAYLLANGIINRNKPVGSIAVTGLGETNFTSDLIVWEGYFEKEAADLKTAYAGLEADKKIIKNYLQSKGISDSAIVFQAVSTRENRKPLYSNEGRYMGEEFIGFILSQQLQIESKDVAGVEKVSREITELLNSGVQFYSQAPRYYYTKLGDLKIEMISKATADAKLRAENIANNSGAKLGKLIDASMGIFQITGQNSNEDYSWGGTYNVYAKDKTASITMRLNYEVKE